MANNTTQKSGSRAFLASYISLLSFAMEAVSSRETYLTQRGEGVFVQLTFEKCTRSCYIRFLRSNDSHRCECDLHPQLNEYVRVFNTRINYTFDGRRYEYIVYPNCPYNYCLLPSPTYTDMTIGITLNETNGA